MKRKRFLPFVIFAVLLALAGYLLLTRGRQETLRPVFTADSLAIARIELSDAENSITFSRSEGYWSISEPIEWGVEQGHFSILFQDVLLETYATTPIASGEQAIEDYGLGKDKALRIKAYDTRERPIGEVLFANPGSPTDYFRYAGDKNIYQIRQKVARRFTPDLESWRSPHALSLHGDQMLFISVTHPNNSYTLTRRENIWHFQDKNEDFDIPPGNQAMGKILNILARLGAYTVLSGDEMPDESSLGDSVCDVSIARTDGSSVDLSFFKYGEDKYLMSVDTHPDMYFVVIFDTVFRFTRHAAVFRAQVGYPGE
ncbi:MAG: DUF4340 domain-containing protein [Candidatus Syntrophosphaera sp.]